MSEVEWSWKVCIWCQNHRGSYSGIGWSCWNLLLPAVIALEQICL